MQPKKPPKRYQKKGITKRKTKPWLTARSLQVFDARMVAIDRGAPPAEVRRLHKAVKKATRADKNEYLDGLAAEMSIADQIGDSKKLFNLVKKLAGKGSQLSTMIKSKQDEVVTETAKRVDRWREHFEELLNRPGPSQPVSDLPFEGFTEMVDDPPSAAEIQKAVKSLKPGKAAGDDGLPPELFKHGGIEMFTVLESLLSKIWAAEEIPVGWRTAVVIPIFKKGSKSDCNNYRGISLLDYGLKILEAVLLERLRAAYQPYTRENQAGFRAGRGCRDQVFTLRQLLENRYEYRRSTVVTFIDFRAAFDSVDRSDIWEICESIGIPAKIISM